MNIRSLLVRILVAVAMLLILLCPVKKVTASTSIRTSSASTFTHTLLAEFATSTW